MSRSEAKNWRPETEARSPEEDPCSEPSSALAPRPAPASEVRGPLDLRTALRSGSPVLRTRLLGSVVGFP